MNFNFIQNGIKQFGDFAVRNSSTILTGFVVGGVITNVALTAKATSVTKDALNDAAYKKVRDWVVETGKKESEYPFDPILSKKEVIQIGWKPFIPVFLMGAATIFCAITSNTVSARRYAVLAGAYELADKALTEYQNKVIERVGIKKEELIRGEVAKEEMKRHPLETSKIIVMENDGSLFFDTLSGRYFKTTMNKVKKAEVDINHAIQSGDGSNTVNQFYDAVGLDHTELGRGLGWSTELLLEIGYLPMIAENDEPCIALEFKHRPHPL